MTTGSTRSSKPYISPSLVRSGCNARFTSGGIDFVITKTESPNIDGLGQTLTQLGYRRDTKFGTSYYAWRRVGLDSAPQRR